MIQQGDRKRKEGRGRGDVLISQSTGERRRRKGKGQLSLSSTLSCFMGPFRSACPDKRSMNTNVSEYHEASIIIIM